jgi:hypothetical protein
METEMLKKAVASGIAVVAIIGVVTAPASARHKKTNYKHGQTTGMSTSSPKTGPGVSGGGAGPSGQAGAAASGSAAGSGGASAGAGK